MSENNVVSDERLKQLVDDIDLAVACWKDCPDCNGTGQRPSQAAAPKPDERSDGAERASLLAGLQMLSDHNNIAPEVVSAIADRAIAYLSPPRAKAEGMPAAEDVGDVDERVVEILECAGLRLGMARELSRRIAALQQPKGSANASAFAPATGVALSTEERGALKQAASLCRNEARKYPHSWEYNNQLASILERLASVPAPGGASGKDE